MKDKFGRFIVGIIIPVILVTLWVVLSESGNYSRIIMPKVTDIFTAFLKHVNDKTLFNDLRVSFCIVLRGYLAGVVLGLFFGVLMGLNPLIYNLLAPLLNSIRQIPPLAVSAGWN